MIKFGDDLPERLLVAVRGSFEPAARIVRSAPLGVFVPDGDKGVPIALGPHSLVPGLVTPRVFDLEGDGQRVMHSGFLSSTTIPRSRQTTESSVAERMAPRDP